MSQVINLGQARKTKARAAKETLAAENRVKFGRTKAEKLAAKAEADRVRSTVDGAKRE